jgi:transcriptional regulator NrdR family protein
MPLTCGKSFRCVDCGGVTQVNDSRPIKYGNQQAIRRRRECLQCKKRFNTYELEFVVESPEPINGKRLRLLHNARNAIDDLLYDIGDTPDERLLEAAE